MSTINSDESSNLDKENENLELFFDELLTQEDFALQTDSTQPDNPSLFDQFSFPESNPTNIIDSDFPYHSKNPNPNKETQQDLDFSQNSQNNFFLPSTQSFEYNDLHLPEFPAKPAPNSTQNITRRFLSPIKQKKSRTRNKIKPTNFPDTQQPPLQNNNQEYIAKSFLETQLENERLLYLNAQQFLQNKLNKLFQEASVFQPRIHNLFRALDYTPENQISQNNASYPLNNIQEVNSYINFKTQLSDNSDSELENIDSDVYSSQSSPSVYDSNTESSDENYSDNPDIALQSLKSLLDKYEKR
ncbi:hypothetical protein BB560_000182 [Smittium megazygosporum]|uniref:Uncharacterized protein n=1 Tax=Smittium megazygosporum TaxID=133381 RepID=A0A2T9ZL59_9FUNG|nr:hypothetical protein BB560_000182 [Smittium megazygosporum]